MKIRTQQYVTACIAGALVLSVGATLLVSSRQLSIALAQNQQSTESLVAISQLQLVMLEYILRHDERPRTQWQQRHESLGTLLATDIFEGTPEEGLIGRVRERHQQLRGVFAKLIRNYEMSESAAEDVALSQGIEAQLVGDLMEATQDMVANVSRVSAASDANVAFAQRRENALLAGFVVLMASMVTINLILTRKQILIPIVKLEEGAAIVGAGDLTFRIGIARDNEIGQLSLAFDRMISHLQMSRAEIEAKSVQLEAANRELEAFAYSASHDLRAPLQTIDGFSRAMLEDYGEKLDADAKDYLQRMRAASQRMAQLVDDLLKLSRLTRTDMVFEPVDLGDLARSAAEELRTHEPTREVALDIAAGATVQGDKRLLAVLMDNLIGNAWKFTSKHRRAKIEFGVAVRDGERAYYVRDDGAGFNMAHVEKLFVPFQRLHAASDFEGNGIGLATVRRIVVRHSGRVWVEGDLEKGATFYFTIPCMPADTLVSE